MILVDTHVLVWLAEGNTSLGPKAVRLIERAYSTGGIRVSAFSFWEIGMLVEKKRIAADAAQMRASSLRAGIVEVAVDGKLALAAARLTSFHGDPADRIIVATALELDATLATADERILGWRGGLSTLDARR